MLLGFGNHVSAVLTGVTICSLGMLPQEVPAATDESLESLQQLSKTGDEAFVDSWFAGEIRFNRCRQRESQSAKLRTAKSFVDRVRR